jgi:DNA invertase Pin-like site-specific DNA recombinase
VIKAYIRVSTDKQEESPAAQREAIVRFAQFSGAPGVEECQFFQDLGVSGKIPVGDRPQGKLLSEGLQKGDTVVVTKLDRLFRSLADAAQTIAEWTEQGIRLVILNLGGTAVDTQSPTGLLFLHMMAAVGQWERGMIAERTRETMRHIKESGRARTTLRPFGYTLGPKRDLHRFLPEQEVLTTLLTEYALGRTIDDLVAWMADNGFKTPSGKAWGKASLWRTLRDEKDRRTARAA